MQAWDIFNGGETVAVLTSNECDEVAARVIGARAAWRERRPFRVQNHVFHTLGAATYLDPPDIYAAHAVAANSVLKDAFGDVLARVIDAISARLDVPVRLDDRLALPGFHIFRGNAAAPTGLRFGGTIHVDTPHERHRFGFAVENTLSFTLPIALPATGAGMFWWHDVPPALTDAAATPYAMAQPAFDWFDANKRAIGYMPGQMVLHDGTTVHQLANDRPTGDDEWRITLQGHGVFGDGGWHLFF